MCISFIIFFQLRYLQTLNTISAEKNSTIIFPVPMDIISHFFSGNKKENWEGKVVKRTYAGLPSK